MHSLEQSDTVFTFFSFAIVRRTGIVSFSAHSSGADVVVVVVVVVGGGVVVVGGVTVGHSLPQYSQ